MTSEDRKKPPPKKTVKSFKKKTPSFEGKFSFETAVSLHHLMLAQRQHAKYWAEQGFPTLLESWETCSRFFAALTEYIEKNS